MIVLSIILIILVCSLIYRKSVQSRKYYVCPKCSAKYKIDFDANGNSIIKGFDDADENELGMQMYCLRCGTKFTVPNVN